MVLSANIKKQVKFNAIKLKRNIYKYIVEEVETDLDNILELADETYDTLLNDKVKDRNSKVIAENYQDLFLTQMANYNYVMLDSEGVSLMCPDMTDFPFHIGQLRSLQTILEGMPYTAVEIQHEYYETLTGKKPLTSEPFDSTVPLKERVYIERSTPRLLNNARELNITLAPYAYSRMAPIDLFTPIKEYILARKKYWISTAQNRAMKNFGKI